MPRRNAMAPPELPRNAPVANIAHPLEVRLRPVLRNEDHAAFFDRLDSRLGQWFHATEPLRRDQRLDDALAALALPGGHLVVLYLLKEPDLVQRGHHLFTRFEAI